MKTALWLCQLGLAAGLATAADTSEYFEAKVRPVLVKNCYPCHTEARSGGLRLDSAEGIAKGGRSGPPIVPGKPDQSLLVQAIRQTHERIKMPPSGKLKDEEIAAIVHWVESGAEWPKSAGSGAGTPTAAHSYTISPEQRAFWAFQPVRKPAVPAVKNTAAAHNEIDHFILSQLEAKGLRPGRAADKRTLIRRATLDLTGLPPTPEEAEAFVTDRSPEAFAKVVDRLLASPRYGERWGRYWLDVARYSDDKLNSTEEDPYPNAFRYRDWVIAAFNRDMPYDVFVKAQIAGDSLKSADPLEYLPGLGFYALSPEMQDERVDATTRGFLGLTVACAQCHDHKFDPIPQEDYYSLQGIFSSSELHQQPLAPKDEVARWDAQKKGVDKQQARLDEFIGQQTAQLGAILAGQTAKFMMATRDPSAAGAELDHETLTRMTAYVASPRTDHPYLKRWFELTARGATAAELEAAAREFQAKVEEVNDEKKLVDEKNKIKLGLNPSRNAESQADLFSLSIDQYNLWRDLFGESHKDGDAGMKSKPGIYYYGAKTIDRFLSGEWKRRAETLRQDLADMKKALPQQYPFLQSIDDGPNPHDVRIAIRGDAGNRGDVAPRHAPSILYAGKPAHFTHGSGRQELADSIASAENPLTARVIVNRLWQHHFGRGIVETPSNFGNMGARPSNQELLDYLAARLVENQWSIKAMHREIMLSAAYARSTEDIPANDAVDADNRLLWRANVERMDAETLRDSLLFVAGNLDLKTGGPPAMLNDANRRRTVYGFISRRKLDPMLALFDFPNPNNTSEQRIVTNVPLQRLFMMNSVFVEDQAGGLAKRLTGQDAERVRQAYELLFGRPPSPEEQRLGLAFVGKSGWKEYARVLLNSNEFEFVD